MIHAQREDFDDRDPFLLCLLGCVGFARGLRDATVDAGPVRGRPVVAPGDDTRLLDALVGLYAVTLATSGEVARRVRTAEEPLRNERAAGAARTPRPRGSLLA